MIWKDIPGFEGKYFISETGLVQNKHNRPLSVACNTTGVPMVTLYDGEGHQKKLVVARIVAVAFIPNPNGYRYVRHIDFNVKNNIVENLEWATMQQIAKRSHDDNINNINIDRLRIRNSKLVYQLDLDCKVISVFQSIKNVATYLGVHRQTVQHALQNPSKVLKGSLWRY